MLRIKDKVDLKELKKFGFIEFEMVYYYPIISDFLELQVHKGDKTLVLVSRSDEYLYDELDLLFDLIQADLVEKV